MYCNNKKCIKYRHWFDGKFCSECGQQGGESLPIDQKETDNINITGDANAVSVNNQKTNYGTLTTNNVNNSGQANYSAQGNVNITNQQVAAQTTEVDVAIKKEERYRAACRRAYEDFVIDANEINELNGLAKDLGLSAERADAILNGVKQQKDAERAREEELTPRAQKRLQRLLNSMRENDVDSVKDQIEAFDEMVNEKNISDLHFVYYLAQAVLNYKKCIEIVEKSNVESYWKSYWSYVAYLKGGNKKEANRILDSIESKFRDYSYVNATLLAATGELMMGNRKTANQEFMDVDEAKLSPCLQRLFDALLLILDPEEAKDNELREKDYLFYLKHIFNYETAEEREKKAHEEREKREAEERRLKVEAEAKAAEEARIKAEQEAKRKAEEERRRKKEEAKRQREAEEARRREEAKRKDEERRRLAEEARLKAAEETRLKAEQEAKRRAEEERKRKEEEERRRKEAEATARKRVTYSITITGVTNQMLAMMTLRSTLGWGSADSRQKLSKIPFVAKQFNDEHSAIEFNEKLSKGGMTSTVTAVNGLGEAVDCSIINGQAQVAAYKEQERRRKEAEERRNQETRQKELDQQRKNEQSIAENRRIYEDACKDVYADGVMTSNEKQRLDALARTLGLSNATCEQILSKVKGSAASKQQYDVTLVKPGAAKLSVVKTVMDVCHLGLKESKELVDGCPSMLKEGLTKSEAEKIKRAIEAVGAEVKLI